MSPDGLHEERVIYRERFQAQQFDFRGKSIFMRFDACEFVKCTLLLTTTQNTLRLLPAYSKDCNIDKLD